MNTTDCISSVQTQTYFPVSLFDCKSLACVLEHRKSLACVLEYLQFEISELSLEVQGAQDYFRFVEGTCIIALCLSSLSLTLFFIRCTFSF